MPTTRLAYLFQRYFEKTASEAETTELMRLLTEKENEEEIQALMGRTWETMGEGDALFTPEESSAMLQGALEGPGTAHGPQLADIPLRRTARISKFPIFRTAAAAVLLLGVGAWWLSHMRRADGVTQTVHPVATLKKGEALPGGNKATLTLGDGSVILLDSTDKGTLATQGGTRVLQMKGGRLAYEAAAPGATASGTTASGSMTSGTTASGSMTSGSTTSGTIASGTTASGSTMPGARAFPGTTTFNTIATPRGGEYRIVLPDGTGVWLNASSSLRFPTAFTGKDREVELRGEAYFEVAQNPSQPFRVKVNDLQVDVLGTHFDVMAYPDEESVNTSLLQGSVRVTRGAEARLLKPGEEARLKTGAGVFQVAEADTDRVVAWKNGLFLFEGATIEEVMRQVSRWYDIDVSYQGEIPTHYSGGFSRSTPLAQVLDMLKLGVKAKFVLEGKKLMVKPL